MINILKTPNVLYNNPDEWNIKKEYLFNKVKNAVYQCIVEDTFEYNYMLHFGLTSRQEINIANILEIELTNISQDIEWSKTIAWDIIVYGIKGFIQGFIKTNTWNKMYNLFTPEDISNIIFENIKYQLDDENHSPCILEDIPQYKCNKCSKIDNYINDSGLCIDCEK